LLSATLIDVQSRLSFRSISFFGGGLRVQIQPSSKEALQKNPSTNSEISSGNAFNLGTAEATST
jgi:hypothetical protein